MAVSLKKYTVGMDRLPKPDEFQNFYFGSKTGEHTGPAIFPSKKRGHEGQVVRNGNFIVMIRSGEFLMGQDDFQRFETAELARQALLEALS